MYDIDSIFINQIKRYTDVNIENDFYQISLVADLGLNSIKLVQLVIDMEEHCGFDLIHAFDSEDMTSIETLGDLLKIVKRYQKYNKLPFT